MSTGETWTLGRRPALDGLRGIAILLVLLFHARVPGIGSGGMVGVTVFFTLSGFLITALLLEEQHKYARIDLRGFYARRARRLFPALVVNMAVVAVLAAIIGGAWVAIWETFVVVALYVGNWIMAAELSLGVLSGTWSLAVEEQFYLVWPLVMMACLRRGPRAVAVVAGVGIVASAAWRWWLWESGASAARVYFGTDARADGLLVGCLLAALMHRRRVAAPQTAWLLPALLAVVVGLSLWNDKGTWLRVGLPTVVPVVTAAVLYVACSGTRGGVLTWSWLTWLGRRSYGMYLWHSTLTVLLTRGLDLEGVTLLVAIVVPSLVLTELSWRFVEEPFLRRRSANPEGAAARLDHVVSTSPILPQGDEDRGYTCCAPDDPAYAANCPTPGPSLPPSPAPTP